MSNTPNVLLNKPNRAAYHWNEDWNENADLIDTAIGGLNNAIDDLPDLERHTGAFNGSTGVSINLNKSVDAANEYGVAVIPTSRSAAIGEIWITKATDSFTVHCADANTSDAFEAIVYFKGDVSSYGGSIYRRYYVSPSTAIADHTIAATAGSLAYIINLMSGTNGVVELPGNRIYTLSDDFTLPSNIKLKPQPGAQLSIASGKTLTVNCRIDAGRWQIFRGDGGVVLSPGSVDYAVPEWFGAEIGGADCGAAINKLADACRANVIPVVFGIGNYYTTESLNFTGANYDLGYGGQGWIIKGMGPGATIITGELTLAHSIVDLSDCGYSKIKNMRIQGAAGNQICGILHGMVGSVHSQQNCIENVIVTGIFAEAAYINHSSDLAKIIESYLNGPCGAIITQHTDACGAGVIKSAYQTLTSTPSLTLVNFIHSQIMGTGGDSKGYASAIVGYDMHKITIDEACYIAQVGTAKAGIFVHGVSGDYQSVNAIEFWARYENQTDAPENGCFVWVHTEFGIRNCIFEGTIGANGNAPDLGQWFYLETGGIKKSKIALNQGGSSEWAHIVQRAAGTSHQITECDIYEQTDPGNLLGGVDAALFGGGNTFHLYRYNSNWHNVTGPCDFFFYDSGRLSVNKNTGYNSIGSTTEKARRFVGHVQSDPQTVFTTSASGEEILKTYNLPGDICYANDYMNISTLKMTCHGKFAGNANVKTLRALFGPSTEYTTIVSNDVTGSPNGSDFCIEVEIARISTGSYWEYIGKMYIGSALQSIKKGLIIQDPSTSSLYAVVTGEAAANDISATYFKIEIL